jgi:hypothetical protein
VQNRGGTALAILAVMTDRSVFAFAAAAVLAFGCAKSSQPEARTARTTTTTTTTITAPAAIGGGPRTDRVDVDGPKRLDPARIERLVSAADEDFRKDCYAAASGTSSFLIDLSISPGGAVEGAEVASVNGDPSVADCVKERLLQMRFPQSAEGGVHTLTFLYGR